MRLYGLNKGKKFNPLFSYIESTTYKKYGNKVDNIRNKILNGKNIIESEIEEIFSKNIAKSFCNIFYKIREKEKKEKIKIERKCKNPYVIHLLDGAIISHIMDLGYLTTLTYINHDSGEMFSDTLLDLEEILKQIPQTVRKNVNLLTNKYKLIAKYLKKRSDEEEKTTWKTKHMHHYLEELSFEINDKRLIKAIFQTEKLLEKYEEKKKYKEKDVIDYLIEISYPSYIYDMIVDAVESSRLENVGSDILIPAVVKIIDRFDNTITDTVMDYRGILDIYNKNTELLIHTRKLESIIKKENSLNAYFLYYLLIDGSFRQLYEQIKKFEGYGKFYSLRFNNPIKRLDDIYIDLVKKFYKEWLGYNKKIEKELFKEDIEEKKVIEKKNKTENKIPNLKEILTLFL